jgi:hypothetical protein
MLPGVKADMDDAGDAMSLYRTAAPFWLDDISANGIIRFGEWGLAGWGYHYAISSSRTPHKTAIRPAPLPGLWTANVFGEHRADRAARPGPAHLRVLGMRFCGNRDGEIYIS